MTNEILQKMQERKKHKEQKSIKRQIRKSDICVTNGRKHGGMKSVKKSKNWNGNTKPKEMHAKVKEISTKKRSTSGTNCIRDKNGKMLFDSNDVINRWVEHVTELYHDERGDPPDVSNQNGCTIMK